MYGRRCCRYRDCWKPNSDDPHTALKVVDSTLNRFRLLESTIQWLGVNFTGKEFTSPLSS